MTINQTRGKLTMFKREMHDISVALGTRSCRRCVGSLNKVHAQSGSIHWRPCILGVCHERRLHRSEVSSSSLLLLFLVYNFAKHPLELSLWIQIFVLNREKRFLSVAIRSWVDWMCLAVSRARSEHPINELHGPFNLVLVVAIDIFARHFLTWSCSSFLLVFLLLFAVFNVRGSWQVLHLGCFVVILALWHR